jgi:hypothetical protein
MVHVTARKIRDHGREPATIDVGRLYSGFLVSYPVIGRGMVIFRDSNGLRMITTAVKRVFGDPDSRDVYVETENSVYRLTLHEMSTEVAPPTPEVPGLQTGVAPTR